VPVGCEGLIVFVYLCTYLALLDELECGESFTTGTKYGPEKSR